VTGFGFRLGAGGRVAGRPAAVVRCAGERFAARAGLRAAAGGRGAGDFRGAFAICFVLGFLRTCRGEAERPGDRATFEARVGGLRLDFEALPVVRRVVGAFFLREFAVRGRDARFRAAITLIPPPWLTPGP